MEHVFHVTHHAPLAQELQTMTVPVVLKDLFWTVENVLCLHQFVTQLVGLALVQDQMIVLLVPKDTNWNGIAVVSSLKIV
jgi:hypothetical protein